MGYFGVQRRLYVLFSLCFFFSYSGAGLFAEPNGDSQTSRSDEASRYTVKIHNTTANIFEPTTEGLAGSGFIVEADDDRVVIFTNLHVVKKNPLDAQHILVEFPLASGRPEAIVGKVVYRSELVDFAVIECQRADFRKKKPYWTIATLPRTLTQFRQLTQKGRRVMAFGNPLDTDQVAAFGEISGRYLTRDEAPYLQTTAPINPGNSGGPLIDVQSGVVVGMNTSKREDADNTGYALPTIELSKMYRSWRKDPSLALARRIKARYLYWPLGVVEAEGTLSLVEKEIPGYSRKYENLLMFSDADKSTGLQGGDLLLTLNGTVVGDDGWRFTELLQASKESAVVKILRGTKVLTLTVPTLAVGIARLRRLLDFVYVEGVVFQETEPQKSWGLQAGDARVVVAQVLNHTAGQESGLVPGSFLDRVELGGRSYRIRRLRDLKKALARRKSGMPLRIFFRSPIQIFAEDGTHAVVDSQIGGALLEPGLSVAFLPVDQDIYTPAELNLRDIKSGFDFGNTAPASRQWRQWIGYERTCREELVSQ